jgi:serine O-acetyltransferase
MASSREIDDAFVAARFQAHRACTGCPSRNDVAAWLDDVLGFVFPEQSPRRFDDLDTFRAFGDALSERLVGLVHDCPDATAFAQTVADGFIGGLAQLHARLEEDADAIVAGDPAAWSRSEVVRSYPGFYAIAAHRVAHALLGRGARMLARMIAAHAHRSTGIDIHPAARIGHRCCVDHGTGLVIGETAELGDDVKLYQGVTLGGLSVRKEDASTKRHPTIGDRVVIYAGATILGGDTVVGHDSVIGGNVWLTRSVPPFSKLTYRAPEAEEAAAAATPSEDGPGRSSARVPR